MKKSWGYLFALFSGLALGWVGQQFWFAGKESYFSSNESSLLRNEQRLQKLKSKEESRVQPKSVAIDGLPLPSLSMINSGQVSLAAALIIDNAELYSENLTLAQQAADALFSQGQYQQAISFLYEYRLFVEPQIEGALLQNIYELVKLAEMKLAEKNQLVELISFYRVLTNLHVDYPPYYLRLAYWLIVSGDLYEAELSLVGASNDVTYQAELEALQRKIAQPDEMIVPLTKVGEHYIVEVYLNEQASVNLMLDTGATMTVIKTNIAESNWPDWLDNAQVLSLNTANGSVKGRQITLPALSISSIDNNILELNDIEIGVMPLPNFPFDGLLGMNILSQFEFSIDQESSNLVLLNKTD